MADGVSLVYARYGSFLSVTYQDLESSDDFKTEIENIELCFGRVLTMVN